MNILPSSYHRNVSVTCLTPTFLPFFSCKNIGQLVDNFLYSEAILSEKNPAYHLRSPKNVIKYISSSYINSGESRYFPTEEREILYETET